MPLERAEFAILSSEFWVVSFAEKRLSIDDALDIPIS
jgi:hypothetical protein